MDTQGAGAATTADRRETLLFAEAPRLASEVPFRSLARVPTPVEHVVSDVAAERAGAS